MNPIAHQPPFPPYNRDDFAGGRNFQVEQTRAGSLSVSQSTAITLTTEEGDRVTLNLSTVDETQVGTYRSLAYGDGRWTASQADFFKQSNSQHRIVEIAGDLNDEELADIQAAVKVIGGMVDDFLKGDLQGMTRDAKALKGLDSISSLEAAFSYERQVMYAQEERAAIKTHGRAHGRSDLPRMGGLMKRLDHLTHHMAEQVNRFHGRQRTLVQSVDALLNQYHDDVMRNEPENDSAIGVIQTIQAAFLEKIDPFARKESGGGEEPPPAN